MVRTANRTTIAAAAAALGVALAGCSAPGGSDGDKASSSTNQITLADAEPVGQYYPVAGYGATGVSPVFEGLLRPSAPNDKELPDLAPALAESKPKVSDGGKTWTVRLKKGVTFHDGSAFDSKDVAATYRAVLDPKSASPIADDYRLIDKVETPDASTVVFRLKAPNGGFASRLLLGIAPSEKVTSGDAANSELNTKPVGTGPFKLQRLAPNEATFVANDKYRSGKPEVDKVVIRHVEDDNARMQQVVSGQVDGSALPPRLAKSVEGRDGLKVTGVRSADWRGVSLPVSVPITSQPETRRALNIGVDREALVEKVLAGRGTPEVSPITKVFPQHADVDFTKAKGAARKAEAEKLLDEAGWKKGADGVRTKDGKRAELTLAYPASDTLRRELASAFADQLRVLGVNVKLWGGSWDDIEPKMRTTAVMLGGGDNPYTVDTQAHRALHSRGSASGPFDNPGNYKNAKVDAALEAAQSTSDETEATKQYRAAQDEYVKDPAYVVLATLHHTYASRDKGFSGPAPIVEPHSHGTTWGPWWSLGAWKKN